MSKGCAVLWKTAHQGRLYDNDLNGGINRPSAVSTIIDTTSQHRHHPPTTTTNNLQLFSSAEVTLHLSITSLEGATATAPTTPPRATTAPPGETSVLAACPPKSQKVVLVLARTGNFGDGTSRGAEERQRQRELGCTTEYGETCVAHRPLLELSFVYVL